MQDKEPISDKNLSEILGFDPNTGRKSEGGADQGLIKNAVPSEIQTAFMSRFEGDDMVIRTHPERLLTIQKIYGPGARRVYHSWEPPIEKQQHFQISAETVFHYINNRFSLAYVKHYGERNFRQMHEFVLVGFDSFQFPNHCNIALSNRFARIEYDRRLRLPTVLFQLNRNGEDAIAHYDEKIYLSEADHKKLSTTGFIQLNNNGESDYEISVVEATVSLRRFEQGDRKDEVTIPTWQNGEKIIRELFSPLTIEDPVNAPPELDDSWRFANLLEVVGVRWERH